MRYDAPEWDAAVKLLAGADAIAIACHVNPDGDALGSLLGASLGLRSLGKKTYPTWGTTPIDVPFSYSFLPGIDSLVAPGDLPTTPVFLALDCAARDRLGELEKRAFGSEHVVNIDHHAGNDAFGTLNVVVPTASSTAELVTYLLLDAGVDLDRDMAVRKAGWICHFQHFNQFNPFIDRTKVPTIGLGGPGRKKPYALRSKPAPCAV